MATVLFVHGTGVRKKGYKETMDNIIGKLRLNVEVEGLRVNLQVKGCLWGDPHGSKLSRKSVPQYQERGGSGPLSEKERNIALWDHLYSDPLYEVRLLSVTEPDVKRENPAARTPGEELHGYLVDMLKAPDREEYKQELKKFHARLLEAGIDTVFQQAQKNILESPTYLEMRRKVQKAMGAFQDALARALVAEAIIFSDHAAVQNDALLRDEVVNCVRSRLGPYQRAVVRPIVERLLTSRIQRSRGGFMDIASPLAGDILLYQCDGKPFRETLRRRIDEEAQLSPPVILVGHSLGGVICVDLLVKEDLQNSVCQLITVGSQAPYFYEIGALQSLPMMKDGKLPTLPPHFPPWDNIFDPRDFLSFAGKDVFPGKIQDHPVDNGEPFPESHSAYWTNSTIYQVIQEVTQKSLTN